MNDRQYQKLILENRMINARINALEERAGTTNLKPKVVARFEALERRVGIIEAIQTIEGQKKDAPEVKPQGECKCGWCKSCKPEQKAVECEHCGCAYCNTKQEYRNQDHEPCLCGKSKVSKPVTPKETLENALKELRVDIFCDTDGSGKNWYRIHNNSVCDIIKLVRSHDSKDSVRISKTDAHRFTTGMMPSFEMMNIMRKALKEAK